jgi:hypothetical protein
MNQLFLVLCAALNTNYSIPNNACSSSFNAIYNGSQTQNEISTTQNYYQNKIVNETYDTFGKNNVYAAIGLGAIVNTYNTKQLQLTSPFKPICDELSLNANENNQTYSLSLKWKW